MAWLLQVFLVSLCKLLTEFHPSLLDILDTLAKLFLVFVVTLCKQSFMTITNNNVATVSFHGFDTVIRPIYWDLSEAVTLTPCETARMECNS